MNELAEHARCWMKTEYQYVRFTEDMPERQTGIWHCRRDGNILGYVRWYSLWEQYCFYPSDLGILNCGCLDDISDFIEQLTNERK